MAKCPGAVSTTWTAVAGIWSNTVTAVALSLRIAGLVCSTSASWASAQSARTAAGYDPLPIPPQGPLSAAPVPAPWDEHKVPSPPASPSSRINLELVLCLASQEALQGGRYNLQLADDCPICHLAVGRHRFLPPAAVTALPASSPSTSSSRSSTELGKNVTLPLSLDTTKLLAPCIR